MPLLVRQSASLADDGIGIQGALAVAAVVAVIGGSVLVASRLDPLLRKFAPLSDSDPRPPVTSARPAPAVPPAPPATPPQAMVPPPQTVAPPPQAIVSSPQVNVPPPQEIAPPPPAPVALPPQRPSQSASLPMTLPATLTPPPRPTSPQTEDRNSEEPQQSARRQRESRSQVARNSRRQQRDRREAEEAAPISVPSGFGAYALVAEARRYIGTNPTNMAKLWCARFTNFVLNRRGYRGTNSDAALSFAHYGQRVSGPRIGAIAVMRRKGGGHVGIVSGVDRHGNPILISGNNGRYGVAETVYPRRRIIAYVMPRR